MSEFISSFGFSLNAAMYIMGVLGSVAIEAAALLRELAANESRLPARYTRWSYPIVRILFAIIGAGPLAVMLSAHNEWTAFYIGATAPLIFDRLAAGIDQDKVKGN